MDFRKQLIAIVLQFPTVKVVEPFCQVFLVKTEEGKKRTRVIEGGIKQVYAIHGEFKQRLVISRYNDILRCFRQIFVLVQFVYELKGVCLFG